MKRLLPALLLLLPLSAQAQENNDFSLFLGSASFSSTEILAVEPEDIRVELAFEQGGAGTVAYNHFWRRNFSTELSLIGMAADVKLNVTEGPVDLSIDAGDVSLVAFTAAGQWHFRRDARVQPYVGAGLALISGEIEIEGEDEEGNEIEESADLEGAATLVVNGGVNFRLNPHWYLSLDAKAMPYEAEIDDDVPAEEGDIDELDMNPFIFSFGVRYRF